MARRVGGHEGLTPEREQRLRALGAGLPEYAPEDARPLARARFERLLVGAGARVVLVAVVAYLAVQWLRPVPVPTFLQALPTVLPVPGGPPVLSWPASGSAALALEGSPSIETAGSEARPVPIAGLASVLTAYVVLEDHPLSPGSTGPQIPVDAATIGAERAGVAASDSEVPVSAGESLSELQALEGLLVASGNDVATLLADWDAGGTSAFVAKLAAAARQLGLDHTRVTDPTGLDPATVSTAADMVRLGEAAMEIPAFAAIVSLGEVTWPAAGVIYNPDALVTHDGFVGIRATSDSAAGGCFLFAVERAVDGQSITVVGSVLGQLGTSAVGSALDSASRLVASAFSGLVNVTVVSRGQSLGRITTAWGRSLTVASPAAVRVIAWPGDEVRVHLVVAVRGDSIRRGERLGTMTVFAAEAPRTLVLPAPASLAGPGTGWRLTRL